MIEALGRQLLNNGTTDCAISLNEIQELYKLGYSLYQTGSYKKSQEILKIVTKLSPFYTDAIFALGMTHFQMKELDQAIRVFDVLEFIDPKDPLASLYIGYTFIEKNNLSEAIQFIKKAISKMEPTHPYLEKAKLALTRLNHDFTN